MAALFSRSFERGALFFSRLGYIYALLCMLLLYTDVWGAGGWFKLANSVAGHAWELVIYIFTLLGRIK